MKRVVAIRVLVIAALFLLIEIVCRIGWVSPFTMPPTSKMAEYSLDILMSGEATSDILITLQNVAIATILAVVVGFLIGLLLHRYPRLRHAVGPLIASYYAVPIFIFYPLLIVIFGLNIWPLIVIGFLFAVVSMVIATLNGFDRLPRVLLKVSRVHRLGRIQEILLVRLPAASPHLFTGVKLSVAYAFMAVVAGEFILADIGVGYKIAFAYNSFDNRMMYGLLLLLLLFVTVVNMALHAWERRIHLKRGRG